MQPIQNYDSIQASGGGFERPGAGGYICRIVNVIDVPMDRSTGKGDYLKIEYDIHEGNFKDYYTDVYQKFGKWWASFIRSYKEKALGMFKHFTDCVEKSNAGYKWNFDESTLKGKLIGLVIGEEEYIKNTGEVGTRLYISDVKTVDQIDRGDYRVPPLKTLKPSEPAPTAFSPITDDDSDLPWN